MVDILESGLDQRHSRYDILYSPVPKGVVLKGCPDIQILCIRCYPHLPHINGIRNVSLTGIKSSHLRAIPVINHTVNAFPRAGTDSVQDTFGISSY